MKSSAFQHTLFFKRKGKPQTGENICLHVSEKGVVFRTHVCVLVAQLCLTLQPHGL